MSNAHKHQRLIQALVLVVLYVGGMHLFVYLKLLGLAELKTATEEEQRRFIPLSASMAFIVALMIALLETYVFSHWKHLSFKRFVIRKNGFIILTISLGGALVFVLFEVLFQKSSLIEALRNVPAFLKSEIFLSAFIYLLIFSIVLNIFRAVSEHLGPQAFWVALLGKYNKPFEEDRTFIFLDLKGSTGIAEKLGHARYSLFINECFQILTTYIYEYDAVLYQFVGDEAVLSWKTSMAKNTLAPLKLYFAFKEHLERDANRFMKEYGITVKFKSSIHAGEVSVTKIQSTKADIVYHGDVLNTSARIMDQCNRLEKDLLVSKIIAAWLATSKIYEAWFVENLILRGKEQETAIYSVNKIERIY